MALFLLAKTNLLPTTHFVALRPSLPFRQAQYVQVSPLKPAPFCRVFAGPGSTNKPAISLLRLTLWQELSSRSSCTTKLQWVSALSFNPGNNAADELARRRALLVLCTIPCSHFCFISHINSCFFSYCLV